MTSFWGLCVKWFIPVIKTLQMFLIPHHSGLLVLFLQGFCLPKDCEDTWWWSAVLQQACGDHWTNDRRHKDTYYMFICVSSSLGLVPKCHYFIRVITEIHLLLILVFLHLKDNVHMTTVRSQAASTIVHATFTVAFTQVASVRGSRVCFVCFFRKEMNPHYSQYITIQWIFKKSVRSSRAAGRKYINIKISC